MQAIVSGVNEGGASGVPAGVLPVMKLTLVRNRESRPQYVTMIRYEQQWVDGGDGFEQLVVVPVRRTMEWVRSKDGDEDRLVCVRSTVLRWRDIKPQPAHREFIDQWVSHAKEQMAKLKKGAKPVKVEVVP